MASERKQRWRGEGAFFRGYLIARVRNQESGEIVNVYQRRPKGAWLHYRDDEPVYDRALAATAARIIANADLKQLDREFREQTKANAEQAKGKGSVRRAAA